MERTQLQRLAETRLSDAEVLLSAQRWDAAYYLLGYCVECALKACIARQFRADDVPDRKLVNSFYTHELDKLLDIAGLRIDMEREATRDSEFAVNWTLVKAWNKQCAMMKSQQVFAPGKCTMQLREFFNG